MAVAVSRRLGVTAEFVPRMDGVDPTILTTAEAAAARPGVRARARWTGRTPRVEVEECAGDRPYLTTATWKRCLAHDIERVGIRWRFHDRPGA
jgi:hypothetical protein